jgi:hypothetical protein
MRWTSLRPRLARAVTGKVWQAPLGKMAGWGARGRPPFQGTVAPRVSPQPTVSIVRRSMEAFHGPLATSKGVRLFGTDALPVGLQ